MIGNPAGEQIQLSYSDKSNCHLKLGQEEARVGEELLGEHALFLAHGDGAKLGGEVALLAVEGGGGRAEGGVLGRGDGGSAPTKGLARYKTNVDAV